MASIVAALTALVALALVEPFATPLGLVPHLALAPMFHWVSRGHAGTGPLGAFLVGLLVDVLTASPLGLAAAAYLAFHGVARRRAAALGDMSLTGRIAIFTALSGAVVGVHGLGIHALSGIAPGGTEAVVAFLATVLAFPLLALAAGPERHGGRRGIRGLGA